MVRKTLTVLLSVLILFSSAYLKPIATTYAEEPEAGSENLGFETDFDGWQANGDVSIQSDGKSGKSALMKSGSSVSKTVTGIPQGSYTVSMWVKGATSGNSANVTISDTGGPDSVLKLDTFLDSGTWREVAHRNVLVYNGQMTIHVNAGTSSGLQVDEVAVTLDSDDNNPVQNWDFENGLANWTAKGEVALDTGNADTGVNSVRLADQSEVSQTIAVKPDTDYIATVRMKVDQQDTYQTTKQYSLDGTSVLGLLEERVTLGNRVNVGVRGTDGVVLRQAPAGTEGYALVTIAFHTGADQTEAELYANTIYDQNYVDSVTVYENKFDDNPYPNGWQRANYEEVNNTHAADVWTSNGSQFAYVDNFNVFEISNDYIKGADMTFLQAIEDNGGKYFANGVQQDALRILSNHGVNSILTTLWVQAGNPVYDWNTLTPLSTDSVGYDGEAVTGRQVITGYFDKKHSVAIGKRAAELGMTYTPSFHYSDTWISAAKAHMPYEWIEKDYEGKLSNPDIQMLETAVFNYVHDTLSEMKSEGVDVIAVKNGNEQDGGLLFPVASGSKYNEHAAIITASTRAVKEVYPGSINMIHTNTGYDPAQISGFFQAFANRGAEFDGMAFSLYGGRETTGQFLMMNAAMQNIATQFDDYINVETGFTFTKESPINDTESTMGLSQYYSATPNGQYNFLLDYMQAPLDLPNPYGTTRGFYYWNAEAIAVYGAGHKAGEAVSGSKRILFNNGTESIKEMGSTLSGKSGDMMDSLYAYLIRGHTKNVSDTVYNPLRFTGSNYDVGEAADLTFENDSLSLKVGEVSRLRPTIAPMDKLLSDYAVHYTSDQPGVAEVSDSGFVTGRSAGTATITANIGSVSKSVTVTVADSVKADGIGLAYDIVRGGSIVDSGTISPDMTIQAKPYDKIKFTSTLSNSPTDKAVVYTVSDPDMAWWYGDTWQTDDSVMRTLADKLSSSNFEPVVQLNPVKGGTVGITVASDDGASSVSFNVAIDQVDVTGISIPEGDSSIRSGRSLQLTAAITPSDASFYKVNWSSDNESVATVDADGKVTGIQPGVATITAASDSNPAIMDSITVTVTDVLVEELLLSNSKMGLLVGDSKTLASFAVPDNAVNKDVVWSVKPGDEGTISVDQNGVVTGLQAGTGTVVATSVDGGNVTAECVVQVVNEPITATSMNLLSHEIWIRSNYFSPDSSVRGESEPVTKLEAVFAPEETTNTDIQWSSNNNEVATVNASGIVTAHKPGVAVITAKATEGGFTDSATVYVPSISEDWENYETGAKGGFTDGNTFTYEVVEADGDRKLQAAVKSQRGSGSPPSLNRRTFTPVGGDEVVVDFDWNVGSFAPDNRSRGANVSIEDANGHTYLALVTYPPVSGTDYEMSYYIKNNSTAMPTKNGDVNGDYNYVHGGGGAGGSYADTANVGVGLKGANKVYHVRATLNFKNRTISFTVTDNNDPSITSTVSGLAMDAAVSYSNSFGAIAFSHYFNSNASWTTSIDNLNVYTTSVQAEKIDYDVQAINMNGSEGIKLVPVEHALSATAKINARVTPAAADQSVAFTPLGDLAQAVSVDSEGTITVNSDALVEYGDYEAIQSVTGSIRVSSVSTPDVYADVQVTVGKPNASEVLQVYADGEEYSGPVTLSPDETPTLTFVATGGDGTSDLYAYDWQVTSGDAQIDSNGVLTALTAGPVTITFTIDLFRKQEVRTLEFDFTDGTVDVTGVEVTPTELTLTEGDTSPLTAVVAPEDATNKSVSWSSSDPSVADVDESGVVTAKKAGTATITVTTSDGSFTAATEVTVEAELTPTPSDVNVTGITVTPTELTLTEGKSSPLTAVVVPEDATNKSVSWSSSDPSVADVDASGVVTAKQAGTATITATTTDGSFAATTVVTVEAESPPPSDISVTSVTVTPTELKLKKGETSSLTAVVAPEDATNKSVSWSSSDPSVADVDASGVVTAKQAGAATITATTTDGSFAATTEVTVEAAPLGAVSVTGVTVTPTELTLTEGESSPLTAVVAPEDATNKSVSWGSSDPSVADVDTSGVVTAKQAGTATITVTTSDGPFTATTEVTVEAESPPPPSDVSVTGVTVTPTELKLKEGETSSLTAVVVPEDATNKSVSWSSSDPSVADIDASGVVTAKQAGAATITATTTDGSFTATTEVTVEAIPPTSNPGTGTSNGGGNTTTPATSANLTIRDGKVVIKTDSDSNGNRKLELTENVVNNAIGSISNGEFQIEVDSGEASGGIDITLPVQSIVGSGTVQKIVLEHNGVKLEIPTDVNSGILGADSKQLTLAVVPVDPGSLPDSVADQVGNHAVYDLNLLVDGSKVPAFNDTITVSLSYALQNGETSSGLVVYYIDESGQAHVVKNSRFYAAATSMVFHPQHFSRYAIAYVPTTFGDLESASWAKDMVASLAARQVVEGVTAESFEPNRSVTRSEFLKMLLSALDLAPDATSATVPFADVKPGNWYYDAVLTGYTLGIVNGKSEQQFGTGDTITREEMAVMLYRAAKAAGAKFQVNPDDKPMFSDENSIADYAKEAVTAIHGAGLVNGFEAGTFGPKQASTRAEAAAVIYRLLGN